MAVFAMDSHFTIYISLVRYLPQFLFPLGTQANYTNKPLADPFY